MKVNSKNPQKLQTKINIFVSFSAYPCFSLHNAAKNGRLYTQLISRELEVETARTANWYTPMDRACACEHKKERWPRKKRKTKKKIQRTGRKKRRVLLPAGVALSGFAVDSRSAVVNEKGDDGERDIQKGEGRRKSC